jgi:hypothetical protein
MDTVTPSTSIVRSGTDWKLLLKRKPNVVGEKAVSCVWTGDPHWLGTPPPPHVEPAGHVPFEHRP